MNKTLILAAPLVMLAATACATAGNGATNTAAAPTGTVQYCKKDKLFTDGDKLMCTWSATKADACENTNLTSLSRGSISGEPASAGRCGNGYWLVSVTTK